MKIGQQSTSHQATGRNFPRDDNYPFRVTVWNRTEAIHGEALWTLYAVFECKTEASAHAEGETMLIVDDATHYYVGEVADD